MSIELSIIVPIYNSEKYLHECLESICQQIKQKVEVILINDCSTDRSVKICKSFAKKFNFIKLINLAKNRGVSYCRNVGISCALGEYISFVDSDDKLLKGSISNILINIKNFYGKDLFVLRYLYLNKKEIFKNGIKKDQIFNLTPDKSIFNCIRCWNFIVKKKFLYLNNIHFKNINITEDWIFVSEIFSLAKSYKIIQKPAYIHQIFEPNTLGKKTGYIIVISRIKVICEISKFLYQNKIFLNKQKIEFLHRILKLAIEHIFLNISICTSNEIKKASKCLYKYKLMILKLSNIGFKKLNFLFSKNINRRLLEYKYKKIKYMRNMIRKFEKDNIILFCAGTYGKIASKNFTDLGAKINFIIDNNPEYSGKKINKTVAIKNPSYLKENLNKFFNHKMLICNNKIVEFNKIKLQLKKIGIKNKNILHVKI